MNFRNIIATLVEFRKSTRSFTKEQAAVACDCTAQTVYNFERGNNENLRLFLFYLGKYIHYSPSENPYPEEGDFGYAYWEQEKREENTRLIQEIWKLFGYNDRTLDDILSQDRLQSDWEV